MNDSLLISLGILSLSLPLLWTWIAGALRVLDGISDRKLDPCSWKFILDLIPVITLGALLGMCILCMIRLRQDDLPYPAAVLSALFHIAVYVALVASVLQVQRALRYETSAVLARIGAYQSPPPPSTRPDGSHAKVPV
jgi:hypothetical protein